MHIADDPLDFDERVVTDGGANRGGNETGKMNRRTVILPRQAWNSPGRLPGHQQATAAAAAEGLGDRQSQFCDDGRVPVQDDTFLHAC